MTNTIQTEADAVALAITFLEKSDADTLKQKYPDLSYDLRSIKPDGDGWLLHFWRNSEIYVVDPPFANVFIHQITGATTFTGYGMAQTEQGAAALAKAYGEEIEVYRDDFFERKYKDNTDKAIWIYVPKGVKIYKDGWIVDFSIESSTAIRDPGIARIYVTQKTGEVQFANHE